MHFFCTHIAVIIASVLAFPLMLHSILFVIFHRSLFFIVFFHRETIFLNVGSILLTSVMDFPKERKIMFIAFSSIVIALSVLQIKVIEVSTFPY